ncbi:MAG: hypothetical protein H7249_17695 [Chitinophagaceae bacterium]|nr:hypothetical protein [Oligoflexus sp.]
MNRLQLSYSSKGLSLVSLVLLMSCGTSSSFKAETVQRSAVAAKPESNTTADAVVANDPAPVMTPTTASTVPSTTVSDGVFKDCDSTSNHSFPADLYELPRDTNHLLPYSSLKSIKKICLDQINITTRGFREGFPGVTDLYEWFSLKFNFNVQINVAGDYQFATNSDDGSVLLIDGVKVIDNDGNHSTKKVSSDKVTLAAGPHKFELQYYQGPADQIALELFWTPPGGVEAYISPALISH